MQLVTDETAPVLSPDEERARKRQAIGLTARRPTAREVIHLPPEEMRPEGKGLMWLAVLLLAVMGLITAWMIYDAVWVAPQHTTHEGAPTLRLADDFTTPHLALPVSQRDDSMQMAFGDGFYRIALHQPGQLVWSTLGILDLTTYRIETALTLAETDASAEIDGWGYGGLVVRYANEDNFYLFTVDGRGAYQIQLQKDEVWRTLQPWTLSTLLHPLTMANQLAIEDDGNQIRFYANGTLLFTITDPRLPGGDVGFVAGTRSQGTVEALFDWVEVYSVPLGIVQDVH